MIAGCSLQAGGLHITCAEQGAAVLFTNSHDLQSHSVACMVALILQHCATHLYTGGGPLTCAGTRYVSGAVLRILRSFPDDWVVHVISADGATQVGYHGQLPTGTRTRNQGLLFRSLQVY